ncbi:MAG: CRTAC1 family protein [Balneola sp.]|nr:MAG: CRTAC1 family protein [Balneola sp.]
MKNLLVLLSLLVIICASCTNPENNSSIFVPNTDGRIGIDAGQSRGVAWGDFDNDGDPDLYVSNSGGQWNSFYMNQGNGQFRKLSESYNSAPGLIASIGGDSQGINWVDIDNDRDLDVYISNRGSQDNFLFENIGDGNFQRIEEHPLVNGVSSGMACWADFDLDGDLDVMTIGYDANNKNRVFRNDLDDSFVEIRNNPISDDAGPGRACSTGDANNDRLPDFILINARQPNAFIINKGDWTFEKDDTDHLTTDVGYSYGSSWADYDNDGDMDIFIANFDKENYLYNNDGNGNFTLEEKGPISFQLGGASKGNTWGDFNNDGYLDFFIANGTYRPEMRNFLYINDQEGGYVRDTLDFSTLVSDTSAGVAHSDFDDDGDLDLYVANWGAGDEPNQFLENTTSGKNWIQINLVGQESNSYGIGAKVELYANGLVQRRWVYPVTGYASQNDYRIHFGLDTSLMIDSVIVYWPSGTIDRYSSIRSNSFIRITEASEMEIIK